MQKEEHELISFLTLLRRYEWLIRRQINNQIIDWSELSEIKQHLLTHLSSPTVVEVTNYVLVNSSNEKIIQLTRNFDAVYNTLIELDDARNFDIEATSSTILFTRENDLLELEIKAYSEKFTEVRKKKEALKRSLDNYFYAGNDAKRTKAELEIARIEPIFQSKLQEYEAKILESKQFFDSNFKLTKSILREVINALNVRIKPLFDIYRENFQEEGLGEYFPMSLVGSAYGILQEEKLIKVDAQTFYSVINLKEVFDLKIKPNYVLYHILASFSKCLNDNIRTHWIEKIHNSLNIDDNSYKSHYAAIRNNSKRKILYDRLEDLFTPYYSKK